MSLLNNRNLDSYTNAMNLRSSYDCESIQLVILNEKKSKRIRDLLCMFDHENIHTIYEKDILFYPIVFIQSRINIKYSSISEYSKNKKLLYKRKNDYDT